MLVVARLHSRQYVLALGALGLAYQEIPILQEGNKRNKSETLNIKTQAGGNRMRWYCYLFQKIFGLLAANGTVEPNLLAQLGLQRAGSSFSGFRSSSLKGNDGLAHASIRGQQSRGQWRWKSGRERIYLGNIRRRCSSAMPQAKKEDSLYRSPSLVSGKLERVGRKGRTRLTHIERIFADVGVFEVATRSHDAVDVLVIGEWRQSGSATA